MLQQLFYDPSAFLLTIVTRIPAVIIGFTIHEFAHALSAVRCGDSTPRNQGRLTLNPASHINAWGFIMLLLFGFGWAKPVQVRPGNFKHPKRDDILVSLMGPLSNLLLAFITFPIVYALNVPELALHFIFQLYTVNLMLSIFNLLPIPPLDGFHIVKDFFGHKNLRFFWFLEQYGMLILFGLSLIGVLGTVIGFFTGWIQMFFMWFYHLVGLM